MQKKIVTLVFALLMALSMVGCSSPSTESPETSAPVVESPEVSESAAPSEEADASADVSIILVTMDGLDNHWVNVDKGAQAAAAELGITYQWMAPDKKDTALQIEMLNNAIAAKCDGLVVAAVDPDAIVSTLQGAADAGIKVVYADSVSNFEAIAKFTTDNYAAAKAAGEQMLAGLEEKGITSGDIGIVAFSNATQTSVDREKGFRDAFEGTEFKLLETQYGNSEVAASQAAAENFISQGVVGVYGNNEPGAVGVGNAVAANPDWAGVAVGFDASNTTVEMVDSGALYCVIAQNPYNMGYGAVYAAYNAVVGKDIGEASVDTGSTIVNKTNVADFK
jgi:ribose transport system substrate-binding protein